MQPLGCMQASKGDGPALLTNPGRILRGSGAGDCLRRSHLRMTGQRFCCRDNNRSYGFGRNSSVKCRRKSLGSLGSSSRSTKERASVASALSSNLPSSENTGISLS